MKHLALVFVLLLLCLPVFAQDATAEATLESTPNAPVIVNVETPVTPPANTDNGMSPLLQVVLAVCAIIVTGSFALEKIGNRAKAAMTNQFETMSLEKLGDSVPQVVVGQITGALERTTKALENITTLWRQSTDRIPESDKPTPISPDTSTVSTHTLASPATQTPSEG